MLNLRVMFQRYGWSVDRRGEAGRTLGEGVAPTTIELSRLNKYLWGRAHRPILLSGQPVKKREEKKNIINLD